MANEIEKNRLDRSYETQSLDDSLEREVMLETNSLFSAFEAVVKKFGRMISERRNLRSLILKVVRLTVSKALMTK